MKINLISKTFKNLAVAGIPLLAFGSPSLLAHNTLSKPTPTQMNSQHEQWMVQRGSIMNPGCCGSGGWGHYSILFV